MDKKKNKISINEFEKAVNNGFDTESVVEWNGLNIIVKKTISLSDTMKLVNAVVAACVNAKTGEYMPSVKDFITRSCIITLYTNVSMPSNLEKQYKLIYGSGIFETIVKYISPAQYNSIIVAIEENVKLIIDSKVSEINKQMNSLYEALDNLQHNVGDSFGNLNPDDIKNLVGTIASGEIDTEKLVRAYLESKNANCTNEG